MPDFANMLSNAYGNRAQARNNNYGMKKDDELEVFRLVDKTVQAVQQGMSMSNMFSNSFRLDGMRDTYRENLAEQNPEATIKRGDNLEIKVYTPVTDDKGNTTYRYNKYLTKDEINEYERQNMPQLSGNLDQRLAQMKSSLLSMNENADISKAKVDYDQFATRMNVLTRQAIANGGVKIDSETGDVTLPKNVQDEIVKYADGIRNSDMSLANKRAILGSLSGYVENLKRDTLTKAFENKSKEGFSTLKMIAETIGTQAGQAIAENAYESRKDADGKIVQSRSYVVPSLDDVDFDSTKKGVQGLDKYVGALIEDDGLTSGQGGVIKESTKKAFYKSVAENNMAKAVENGEVDAYVDAINASSSYSEYEKMDYATKALNKEASLIESAEKQVKNTFNGIVAQANADSTVPNMQDFRDAINGLASKTNNKNVRNKILLTSGELQATYAGNDVKSAVGALTKTSTFPEIKAVLDNYTVHKDENGNTVAGSKHVLLYGLTPEQVAEVLAPAYDAVANKEKELKRIQKEANVDMENDNAKTASAVASNIRNLDTITEDDYKKLMDADVDEAFAEYSALIIKINNTESDEAVKQQAISSATDNFVTKLYSNQEKDTRTYIDQLAKNGKIEDARKQLSAWYARTLEYTQKKLEEAGITDKAIIGNAKDILDKSREEISQKIDKVAQAWADKQTEKADSKVENAITNAIGSLKNGSATGIDAITDIMSSIADAFHIDTTKYGLFWDYDGPEANGWATDSEGRLSIAAAIYEANPELFNTYTNKLIDGIIDYIPEDLKEFAKEIKKHFNTTLGTMKRPRGMTKEAWQALCGTTAYNFGEKFLAEGINMMMIGIPSADGTGKVPTKKELYELSEKYKTMGVPDLLGYMHRNGFGKDGKPVSAFNTGTSFWSRAGDLIFGGFTDFDSTTQKILIDESVDFIRNKSTELPKVMWRAFDKSNPNNGSHWEYVDESTKATVANAWSVMKKIADEDVTSAFPNGEMEPMESDAPQYVMIQTGAIVPYFTYKDSDGAVHRYALIDDGTKTCGLVPLSFGDTDGDFVSNMFSMTGSIDDASRDKVAFGWRSVPKRNKLPNGNATNLHLSSGLSAYSEPAGGNR